MKVAVPVRPYESIVIMNPDITEETAKSLFRKNKEIIESFGGKVNHVDTWGKRQLANMIGKHKRAVFFHTTFTSGNKAVAELERTMRNNESVLRFVNMRLDDNTELRAYVESFKNTLKESAAREKERSEKMKKRFAPRVESAESEDIEE